MSSHPVPSRLFQCNIYRLYIPEEETVDITQDHIVCYKKRHPNRQMGRQITFLKKKNVLLKAAAVKVHLRDNNYEDPVNTYRPVYTTQSHYDRKNNNKTSIIEVLPKEILLQIFQHLDVKYITNFAKTSRYSRIIAYDNLLWKYISIKTWCNPYFMLVDLNPICCSLRLWYNENSNKRMTNKDIMFIFLNNIWRLIYIALSPLDSLPSIVDTSRIYFPRKIECFATTNTIQYSSLRGNFILKGVNQVGRVEYTVFNYTIRPWHRNEYSEIAPYPIFNLRDFGLKLTRSARAHNGVGNFQRRGYYMKTDENRKVFLTYRYFPTVRFRLYTQGGRTFLLCQDLFIKGGESISCYTMYEIFQESSSRQTSNDDIGFQDESSSSQMSDESSSSQMNAQDY